MPISLGKLKRLMQKEIDRKNKIVEFFRANPNIAFTDEDIKKETGITCASVLMVDLRDSFGIKRERLIKLDSDRWCGYEDYYYYKTKKSKTQKKGFVSRHWWQFWK